VTFHRAGEIRNNVRSYLKFLFRKASRSSFSIRHRRSFRSSRKYRERNAGKRSLKNHLEAPSRLFRIEKKSISVKESVIKIKSEFIAFRKDEITRIVLREYLPARRLSQPRRLVRDSQLRKLVIFIIYLLMEKSAPLTCYSR